MAALSNLVLSVAVSKPLAVVVASGIEALVPASLVIVPLLYPRFTEVRPPLPPPLELMVNPLAD